MCGDPWHSRRRRRFRLGDWVERIASSVTGFGFDRRLRYVSAVRPKVIDGERCLVVDGMLADTSPDLNRNCSQVIFA